MGSEKQPQTTSRGLLSLRRHGLGLVPGIKTRILISGTAPSSPLRRAPKTTNKKKTGNNVYSQASLRRPTQKRPTQNKEIKTVRWTEHNKLTAPTIGQPQNVTAVRLTATTPSCSNTFESLRNLCVFVGSLENCVKDEPLTINDDTGKCALPLSVLGDVKINSPNTPARRKQIQSPAKMDSEDHPHEIICKVIHPRQIELDTFLHKGGCDTADVMVVEVSSTDDDANSVCSISEVPRTDLSNAHAFDSLRQLATNYLQGPAPSSNKGRPGTRQPHPGGASTQGATVKPKQNNGKACLKASSFERPSVAFDTLRQLVNCTLKAECMQKKQSATQSGEKRTCDECGHVAKSAYDLTKHIKYKHGPSAYVCPMSGCSFSTKYPNNVRHHQTKHTHARPHQCATCKMKFKRKAQLKTHMLRHSDERPFKCDQCDYRTKRGWVLTQHVKSKHCSERSFQCEKCGFRMKTRSDMNKHRVTHAHRKELSCPECDKTFTHQARLRAHQQNMHSNRPRLPCPELNCKQRFKQKTALRKHINVVHRGIKNFCCDVCRRTFSTKSNLESHMVTHDTTDRPFKCPICPYSGKEEAHVRAHMGSMHDVQMSRFACDMCGVSFRVGVGLRQHLTTYKHQQNVRLRMPPMDMEVKPKIVSTPPSGPHSSTEGIEAREDLQCVIVKKESSNDDGDSR